MAQRLNLLPTAQYYQDSGVRVACHEAKLNSQSVIFDIARHMANYAKFLPAESVLIPVPSRLGYATVNLSLALYLEQMTGLPVADIAVGRSRESIYDVKRQGGFIDSSFFGFQLENEFDSVLQSVLLDIVYDSGQTCAALSRCFRISKPVSILTFASVVEK